MIKRSVLFLTLAVLIIVAACTFIFAAATDSPSDEIVWSEGEGMTFDGLSLYSTAKDNPMTEVPVTYEAYVKLPAGYSDPNTGTIFGNYRSADLGGVRFRLRENGRPHMYYTGEESALSVNFYDVNVATGEWVHLTVVDDVEAGKMLCYVDGNLVEEVEMTDAQKAYNRDVSGMPMCLGGDFIAGTNNFKGDIRSVVVFNEVRTVEQIQEDMYNINLSDDSIIAAYYLNDMQNSPVIPDLVGNYDMINNRMTSDWANPDALPELEEFSYSMALIGDTQIVTAYYPDELHNIFDWLLENKDTHKIEHVLNMGDMTNFNLDSEWDLVRDQYFRLNGEIDYTLVRGDHDVLDDDVDDNGDDTTKYDRWFNVPAYTDRFTNSVDADYYKGENGSITNSYRALEIKGNKYLIVTVDKYPSEEVLSWIDSAIKKYPNHRVIMTMHCFINDKGEYIPANSNPDKIIGIDLWDRIKGYENLEMVICGHEYAYGVVWTKAEGTNGNVVNNILANPQGPDFDREGATGMIAMLYFSEDGTDVQVRYYSPIIDKYFVGNNNELTSDTYKLESSVFKMTTDDLLPAVQTTEFNNAEKVYAEAMLYTSANVSTETASVTMFYDTSIPFTNGSIMLKYDSLSLFGPELTWTQKPENVSIKQYIGSIVITFDGFVCKTPENEGESYSDILFTVTFDCVGEAGDISLVDIATAKLGYTENGTEYSFADIAKRGTVISSDNIVITYNAGDDFEAKLEEALVYAKYTNVDFVMKSGFTATKSITIGDINTDYLGMVYIYSEDKENPVEINTGGYNIILIGKYSFDYIKLSGNGSGESNSLFFPNGSEGYFYNNMTAGENKANVTGAYLTIYSGEYYFVGALIDDTIGMSVKDAYILFGGNAVADCVSGGSRLSGNVYGWSVVNIQDDACVTRYASASGYASGGCHDGQLEVDTNGTIGRLCAVVGPVGSQNNTPDYMVNINNVKCTTDTGIMGVRSIVKNKTTYANVSIEINGGTYTKESYLGMYAASNYAGAKFEGNVSALINDGDFDAAVYGGGYLDADGAEQFVNTYLGINGGDFGAIVYGGSKLLADNTVNDGYVSIYVDNEAVIEKGLYGGSNILNATAEHLAYSDVYITNGTVNSILFAGSIINVAEGKNVGDSSLTVYKGTFGGRIFGGAALAKADTLNEGNSSLYIYGGNTFTLEVIGGVRFDKPGTGYASNGGDGSLSTGNVDIYIYDYDIDGNPAVSTFNGPFYGSFFGITAAEYSEMSGYTFYDIRGAVFNNAASAGPRLQAPYQKQSGDVMGTVTNITAENGFFGGATINNKSAVMSGNTSMTVGDGETAYNVTDTLGGGSFIGAVNSKVLGDSKLTLSEGVTVKSGTVVVGGNYAGANVFSATGAKTEWGFYGSSELEVDGATVESGAVIVGGAYVNGTPASKSVVDWEKYPVNGGVAGSSQTTKLVINSGTVNGPCIYAGSYLLAGGQDHGTVELEINGGKVVMTTGGITNYGTTITKALYPATYYPVNNKALNCNYSLSLNDGEFDFPRSGTNTYSTIGICGGMSTYAGTITGDTVLVLGVDTAASTDFTYRPANIVGGHLNFSGSMIGDSQLTVEGDGTLNSSGIVTAGCASNASDSADVEGDGINQGFRQTGDVYFNFSGGKLVKKTYVSGYRSNVDGNVYINISGGAINGELCGTAGDAKASNYSSVTGDVIWNISGGTFKGNVYGGGYAAANFEPATGYNVIGGNLYMEISGGTFNGTVSLGGFNGVNANNKASIKFVGSDYEITSTAKFIGHGNGTTSFSSANDESYILDLWHCDDAETVKENATKFGTVLLPLEEGATVILSNTSVANGTDLAGFMEGQTVTVNGNAFKYDDMVYFNDYTEYKNGFDFYTYQFGAEKKIDEVYAIHKVKVGEGADRSAEIVLTNTSHSAELKANAGASLLVTDSIAINITSKAATYTAFTDVKVTVLFAGEEYVYEAPTAITTDKSTYSFENIGPHMMDEMAYIIFSAKDSNGNDVTTSVLSMSVKKYAKTILSNNYADSFKTVCMDLLNYGAAAQVYADYNADVLVTEGMEAYQNYASTESKAATNQKKVERIDNPTVLMKSVALYIEKNAELRFKVETTEDIATLTAKVEFANGSVYTITSDKFTAVETEENRYFIRVNQFGPHQMREAAKVTVYQGETAVSHSITYSIDTYVYEQEALGVTGAMMDTAKAMLKYGDAVSAWLAE